MRPCRLLPILIAAAAFAQQAPFIRINAPNVPKGADYLLEDTRGGMWLAGAEPGSEGLTYFDGSRFLTPLKAYPKIDVNSMAEDSAGGIWLASNLGLYRFYQGQLKHMFEDVAVTGTITPIASDAFILTFRRKGSSSLYGELARITYSKGTWKLETIFRQSPSPSFFADHSGNLLYLCESGYCSLRADDIIHWRPGWVLRTARSPLPFSLPYESSNVMRDSLGCVWMRDVASAFFQCPGDHARKVLPANIASFGNPQILELSNGSVVISGFNKLAIGRPGAFRVLSPANGYPSTGWNLVTKDDSVWLSNANGLFILPSRFRMEFWTERDGLEGNTWSVLRRGTDMFAVAGDSIRILNKDRSRWRAFAELPGATHLTWGPGGSILGASRRMGIVQFNPRGQVIARSQAEDIATISQGSDGQFWALGSHLWHVQVLTSRIHLQVADPRPLAAEEALMRDSQGHLWFCSDGGLFRNAKSSWELQVQAPFSGPLPCDYFTFTKDNRIWYDSREGPRAFEIRNHLAVQANMPPDPGPPTSNFLNTDTRNWLWRGTTGGIYIAEPEQALKREWLHLDRSNGLPAVDANKQSFFEDSDGSVWFGADNSIVHIYPPADFLHPRGPPDVFVSAFSINGGELQMADLIGNVKSGSNVTAYIGSLQFDRRNALRIRYRLLPEQKTWRETRSLDLALGKLGAGSHTLEVEARLFTGPWSRTVSSSFTILQPVWLTWPWLLTYFIISGALSIGTWMLHRMRQHERKLLPDLAEWRLDAFLPEIQDVAGTLLDSRYEVGAVLARGGFANVMAGYDRALDRRCAIKIFRNELKNKTSIIASFEREIAALQQIRHANVVSIYSHGATPSGTPYLVMEFVAGKSLREVLEKGSLKPHRIAQLLSQMADALDSIHAQGICHRDVKPENIIVGRDDKGREHAVLIDFSIAIIKDANETLYGLSRAAGSFDYMAPEQALGGAMSASDIYALAKVVIEMLTGRRVAALLPNAVLDLPLRIRELLQTRDFALSTESIEMLATALEFDPTKRPKRVSTFAASIVRDLMN